MQRGNSDPAAEALSEEHQQSRDLQVGNTCTEPKPTMEQLDAQLAEMEDSKHDLRLNIYQIKRERNALVPLHRLPGEIFVSILLKVARGIEPGSELEYGRLHILAQVSTYWFDTIIAFPSFWQQLAPYHPPHFRETVLKRNPSGLFDIECVLRDGDTGPRGEKLLSFMKMAASLSQRWKQLAFAGEMTDEIMEFLRTPAPKATGETFGTWISTISLSRGAPLASVDFELSKFSN
ncbi:hypothetical protein FRC01_004327 [Tulasnella sp. 417]|nr:hypothetical protein FRC01_004327 [Tulasnella sp. 417]